MRQIKKLIWLQACFVGDVRVIWCNSLGDSLFQILCDEFCRNCDWFLFTYHLTCLSNFASCTDYTSYSLLNFVQLLCVILVWPIEFENSLNFMQNVSWSLRIWELFENLNFGKTEFKRSVFEKHFILYSCILFIKYNTLKSLCIKLLCFFFF